MDAAGLRLADVTGALRTPAARRAREYVKVGLRSILHRQGYDLVRDPFPVRVATLLNWLPAAAVLDVGANIGQYGSALRAGGYRGRIVSCEPLSDAFAHLQRRTARDVRWTAVRTAVGDTTGSTTINVSANSYSSSLLPMTAAHRDAAPGSEFVSTETVPVTTVRDLVTEHGVDPARALLKIDTQGFESAVLDGAGDLVGQFAAVALELSMVPLYEGQQLYDALVGRLGSGGYTLYGIDAGIGDPATGRMLQCDGLFVRTDLVTDV